MQDSRQRYSTFVEQQRLLLTLKLWAKPYIIEDILKMFPFSSKLWTSKNLEIINELSYLSLVFLVSDIFY